jgi:hypothetical protein
VAAGFEAAAAVAIVTVMVLPVQASAAPLRGQPACRPAGRFAHLPRGWAQQASGCASRLGGSLSAWSEATSWRYRPNPLGPVHQMRPDRVLISVILLRPSGFPASSASSFRPLRNHPLRVGAADQVATEKDASTIRQYRFFRRVGCQYDLDLRIDFRTATPQPQDAAPRTARPRRTRAPSLDSSLLARASWPGPVLGSDP